MKRSSLFISIVLILVFSPLCLFGVGEKIIAIGAAYGWEAVEKRSGVVETPLVRPHPVLILAGAEVLPAAFADASLDLYLSFDEGNPGGFADKTGRWDVSASPAAGAVPRPWSRAGEGAARFTGLDGPGRDEGPLLARPRKSALFGPRSRAGDFSLEFWLYPMGLENGEQILSWTSSRPDGQGGYAPQRIQCVVLKNRLRWTFSDFFIDPLGQNSMTLSLSGPPLTPKAWSHHLVRFNADLGLVEYLVDGRLEAVDYATSTGREGGEIYTSLTGENCGLTLGNRFTGLIDEFRIYSRCVEDPAPAKFPREGRIETRTLDLGKASGRILKIEAFGGQSAGEAEGVRNTYAGNAALRFDDYSELQFFIRANNTPYRWNGVPWVPVKPGEDLHQTFRGRYIQVAADFYPSGSGETSPYLDELRIIYRADDPPLPPSLVTVAAKDGAVELSWKASPDRDLGGYLVYYGTSSREYFGDYAILEGRLVQSPIDAGNRLSLRIEGLKNGTLYYFAVAAYDRTLREAGGFSREAAARPLRMIE